VDTLFKRSQAKQLLKLQLMQAFICPMVVEMEFAVHVKEK
jgi:hypothetical protein